MNVDLETWISRARGMARTRGLADDILIKVTPPAHQNGGHVIDFDGTHVVAQFIVWPSGAIEASHAAVATEHHAHIHNSTASNVEELDKTFDEFLHILTAIEKQA